MLGEEKKNELYFVLKSKFGFSHFRHRQKQAIVAALLGYDTFILMPTGYSNIKLCSKYFYGICGILRICNLNFYSLYL